MHVQSTGLRFATGGADSQVKVWSVAPVTDVQQEQGGPPPLLATLTDHSSTVNTVRFSKNAKFLASGGSCSYNKRARPFVFMLTMQRLTTIAPVARAPQPGHPPLCQSHPP